MSKISSYFKTIFIKKSNDNHKIEVKKPNIVNNELSKNNDENIYHIESQITFDVKNTNERPCTYPRPDRECGKVGKLRSPFEIPSAYRYIFSKYDKFNEVQSMVFDAAYYTDNPIIVSAPTGSGKTVIFELAIIRLLLYLEDIKSKEDFKIVYLAPIKSLCSERYYDWCEKFRHIGIKTKEVTGDSDIFELNELEDVNILICTPEKWDALTRKWKEYQDVVNKIRLFLIDEIHLINEDRRGPVLETVISRMKTIAHLFVSNEQTDYNLRFIGASATIPNIEDLALWLGETTASFKLCESARPVPLQKRVLGYDDSNYFTYFKFDMSLNYKLANIIQTYSKNKPTLIFCSTRKGVEMAADVLRSNIFLNLNNQTLITIANKLSNQTLKKSIIKGVAYHHAGLIPDDRKVIEQAFRDGCIPVLLCTTTLAMGVNLPAHLVIIKSTQMYMQGCVSEYSESSVLQMIGRAGRPQFDTSGTAVIMTQSRNKNKYEQLLHGVAPVESHLHKHLVEHLNSEISLQTITDTSLVMKWIKSTFLYVRAIKNPKFYGFIGHLNKEMIEKELEDMCHVAISSLENFKLLSKVDTKITSTPYGKLMAKYYLNFNTMKIFRQIKGNEELYDLIKILSKCYEFSEFNLRTSDKKSLNELNSSKSNKELKIRFPIKGRIKSVNDKVSCLMQAVLGNLNIVDGSLIQESNKIIQLAEKISKALVDYIRVSESKNQPKYAAMLNAIILSKCISIRMWENSPYVAKQFRRIGAVGSGYLVAEGKTTFKSILETSPRDLERIVNKAPPFGNEIIETVSKLPNYRIELQKINNKLVKIIVKQVNDNYNIDVFNKFPERVSFLVGDGNNNLLLLQDRQSFQSTQNVFERTFRIVDNCTDIIFGHVIHHHLVGIDENIKIDLKLSNNQEAITILPKSVKQNKKNNTKSVNPSKLNNKENHCPLKKLNNLNLNEDKQGNDADIIQNVTVDDLLSQTLSIPDDTIVDVNVNINQNILKENTTDKQKLIDEEDDKICKMLEWIRSKPSVKELDIGNLSSTESDEEQIHITQKYQSQNQNLLSVSNQFRPKMSRVELIKNVCDPNAYIASSSRNLSIGEIESENSNDEEIGYMTSDFFEEYNNCQVKMEKVVLKNEVCGDQHFTVEIMEKIPKAGTSTPKNIISCKSYINDETFTMETSKDISCTQFLDQPENYSVLPKEIDALNESILTEEIIEPTPLDFSGHQSRSGNNYERNRSPTGFLKNTFGLTPTICNKGNISNHSSNILKEITNIATNKSPPNLIINAKRNDNIFTMTSDLNRSPKTSLEKINSFMTPNTSQEIINTFMSAKKNPPDFIQNVMNKSPVKKIYKTPRKRNMILRDPDNIISFQKQPVKKAGLFSKFPCTTFKRILVDTNKNDELKIKRQKFFEECKNKFGYKKNVQYDFENDITDLNSSDIENIFNSSPFNENKFVNDKIVPETTRKTEDFFRSKENDNNFTFKRKLVDTNKNDELKIKRQKFFEECKNKFGYKKNVQYDFENDITDLNSGDIENIFNSSPFNENEFVNDKIFPETAKKTDFFHFEENDNNFFF